MAAAELGRLEEKSKVSEQDLLNQDRGRSPSTEEGRAKKENRKKELADAIGKLKQAIAQLREIGQKLKK